MLRYLVSLGILAVISGSLFRGAHETGVGLLGMFGTLGIFLFGVIGSMAVGRWQQKAGLRAVQEALGSLAPEYLITDWEGQDPTRPDYLVVGPRGLIAICLDHTPQSARPKQAAAALARSRSRALQTLRLLEERLAAAGAGGAGEVSRQAEVVLTRRRAEPYGAGDAVAVVNPEQLAAHIRAISQPAALDRRLRIQLTRLLRAG